MPKTKIVAIVTLVMEQSPDGVFRCTFQNHRADEQSLELTTIDDVGEWFKQYLVKEVEANQ